MYANILTLLTHLPTYGYILEYIHAYVLVVVVASVRVNCSPGSCCCCACPTPGAQLGACRALECIYYILRGIRGIIELNEYIIFLPPPILACTVVYTVYD